MYNGKSLIAFLGYIRSLKWFKSVKTITTSKNNINFNNIWSNSLYNSLNNYDNNNNNNYNKDRSVLRSKIVEDFLKDKNLKPVFIYEDLKNQEVKDKIKNNTKDLSGVYLILNKTTLDYYIGSASTDKFYTRFYRHLINLTGSKIVKLAVRKYGIDNFSFLVLELFPEKVNVENNKKLLDLEDFYLKSLLPNYNILTEAGSSFGYKHTEISRIKIKSAYSDERREAIGNLNKGKTFTEETKNKMSKSFLSRVKPTFSEKSLSNMRKNSKPIILYNINNNTVYGEFNSITEAASHINCNEKTIRRSLQTDKKILLRR
jgi:group I intron endonuclease